MTKKTLILRYTCFAIIATLANLLAQRLVLSIDNNTAGFVAALGVGTLVGLAIKFYLDKYWIFFDNSKGVRTNGKQFILYSIMGIVTTLIFWGTETAFWLIWKSDILREIGAIVGLAIGYIVKYNLDRRFVFTDFSQESQK
ncbi:GtrA family protein [Maritalea porphyrae]|uniref:GtrA family protein n=1 Tax=Maritalea porphyrae TaxID=880732 RepID=UPI0024E10827|nr:GtrA family protein [Maritalea porphyrae]